jgi:hypothetical protein
MSEILSTLSKSKCLELGRKNPQEELSREIEVVVEKKYRSVVRM